MTSQSASRVRLSIGLLQKRWGVGGRRRSDDRRVTCPGRNIPLRIEHSRASRCVPPVGRRCGNAQPRERKRNDRHRGARFQSSDALAQRHHGARLARRRLLAAIFLPTTSSRCAGSCTIRRRRNGPVVATVTVSSDAGRAVYQTPFAPARPPLGHCARIPLTAASSAGCRTVATVEAVSATPKRVSVVRT